MQDLHNGNVMIIRHDGKPFANDFSDETLRHCGVKILDLGLAYFKQEKSKTSVNEGEVEWGFRAIRAPETFVTSKTSSVHVDFKGDIWALGILICEAALLKNVECVKLDL